jgi:hypothetical protein
MSEPSQTKPDAGLMSAVRYVAGSAVVLAVVTGLVAGPEQAIGAVLGGLLATANLLLFVRLGKAFLAQGGRGSPWVALAVIKLLGLFAAMFILLRHTDFSALSLLVGYGALPIGIVLAGVLGPRPPDDADLSAPADRGAEPRDGDRG